MAMNNAEPTPPAALDPMQDYAAHMDYHLKALTGWLQQGRQMSCFGV